MGTVLRRFDSEELTFVPDEGPLPIERLEPTITNTVEFGYKGLIGDRVLLVGDVWRSEIEDFIGPLRVETPSVFLDPVTTAAFIQERLTPLVQAGQITPEQLAGIVSTLTSGLAQVPIGTGLAFANTFLAPMSALVAWTLLDYFRTGRATAVGAATGIVVGLVAVTPAAGFVSPAAALLLGAIAALPSYFVISLRSRTRIDDSLDVLAGHGIGGLTGALLTGVLAQKVWNSAGADGLLSGNPAQLGLQALGALSSAAYAALATFVILKALALVTSLRAVPKVEGVGMDVSQHGEEAYASGEGSILVQPDAVFVAEPRPALTPQVAS